MQSIFKRVANNIFSKLSNKWLDIVLKYPIPFEDYAKLNKYPNTYLCNECFRVGPGMNSKICVSSGRIMKIDMSGDKDVTLPEWWVKYSNLMKDSSEEIVAKGITIYKICHNGSIHCSDMCPAIKPLVDVEFLPYSEISKKDFIRDFHKREEKIPVRN